MLVSCSRLRRTITFNFLLLRITFADQVDPNPRGRYYPA
jgi:hypothetical protein